MSLDEAAFDIEGLRAALDQETAVAFALADEIGAAIAGRNQHRATVDLARRYQESRTRMRMIQAALKAAIAG